MKSQRKILKSKQLNGNENTTYANLWEAAKVILRGKLRVLPVYITGRISNQSSKFLSQIARGKKELNKAKIHIGKETRKRKA